MQNQPLDLDNLNEMPGIDTWREMYDGVARTGLETFCLTPQACNSHAPDAYGDDLAFYKHRKGRGRKPGTYQLRHGTAYLMRKLHDDFDGPNALDKSLPNFPTCIKVGIVGRVDVCHWPRPNSSKGLACGYTIYVDWLSDYQ